jgi:hypothetical protein
VCVCGGGGGRSYHAPALPFSTLAEFDCITFDKLDEKSKRTADKSLKSNLALCEECPSDGVRTMAAGAEAEQEAIGRRQRGRRLAYERSKVSPAVRGVSVLCRRRRAWAQQSR